MEFPSNSFSYQILSSEPSNGDYGSFVEQPTAIEDDLCQYLSCENTHLPIVSESSSNEGLYKSEIKPYNEATQRSLKAGVDIGPMIAPEWHSATSQRLLDYPMHSHETLCFQDTHTASWCSSTWSSPPITPGFRFHIGFPSSFRPMVNPGPFSSTHFTPLQDSSMITEHSESHFQSSSSKSAYSSHSTALRTIPTAIHADEHSTDIHILDGFSCPKCYKISPRPRDLR